MTALWTILLRSLMEFFSYHLEAQFCPICDKGGESSSECQFYRKDSRLAYEGKLPTDYANIRRHRLSIDKLLRLWT
jgi:hypothetical protein